MCWSFLSYVRFLILLTVFELLPKTCNFTICSIFSNSSHVGWCTALPDTILKLDTLVMKIFEDWGEDFWKGLRRMTDDRRRTKSDDNSSPGLKARWAKKGINSRMGNQIYFKITGYVDLDVLIISTPCQIFDIINGFWAITQNLQFYHMFYF